MDDGLIFCTDVYICQLQYFFFHFLSTRLPGDVQISLANLLGEAIRNANTAFNLTTLFFS